MDPNYIEEDEEDYNENPDLRRAKTTKIKKSEIKEDKSRWNKCCDFLDFRNIFKTVN